MSQSHQDTDYAIACEQERRRKAKADNELREMHGPSILQIAELGKEARQSFNLAKQKGFNTPEGAAYEAAEERFREALRVAREYDESQTQTNAPQDCGEGETEPDHVLRGEVPQVLRHLRAESGTQQGPN